MVKSIKVAIIIPARYGSSRLPGKPLVKIAGKEMVQRVYENAQIAASKFNDVNVYVATDDSRIAEFLDEIGAKYVMTSIEAATGTDRVYEAALKLEEKPTHLINYQGDNPTAPPWFVEAMIEQFMKEPEVRVVTPCVRLSWEEYDKLKEHKIKSPGSGTLVTKDKANFAYWFSKNFIPNIKKYDKYRDHHALSPYFRHVGLYGYSLEAIKFFCNSYKGFYEEIEELEQLRFIENGVKIKMVEVDYNGRSAMSGVDAPSDVEKAEQFFKEYGEYK
jgi:3-deoxy-manno-octulosonate cytidylyltransferase (CMP-KDO synthetase)